jgi:hypothetical protein
MSREYHMAPQTTEEHPIYEQSCREVRRIFGKESRVPPEGWLNCLEISVAAFRTSQKGDIQRSTFGFLSSNELHGVSLAANECL